MLGSTVEVTLIQIFGYPSLPLVAFQMLAFESRPTKTQENSFGATLFSPDAETLAS
jgi:hypothetical protein